MRHVESLESRFLFSGDSPWTLPPGTYSGTLTGGGPFPATSQLVVTTSKPGHFWGTWTSNASFSEVYAPFPGSGVTRGSTWEFKGQGPYANGSKGIRGQIVLTGKVESSTLLSAQLKFGHRGAPERGNGIAWSWTQVTENYLAPVPLTAQPAPPKLLTGTYSGLAVDSEGNSYPMNVEVSYVPGLNVTLHLQGAVAYGSGTMSHGQFSFTLGGITAPPANVRLTVFTSGKILDSGKQISGKFSILARGRSDHGTLIANFE